jgi:hypothetical protein
MLAAEAGLKKPGFFKKPSPLWVLWGFLFIAIHMTGERDSRVTYLSNIASSGIQVLQICSQALSYLFNELLRLGIHILCRGGARFSGLEGPKFFLLSPSSLKALPPPPPEVPGFTRISWIVLVKVGSGLLNLLASAAPDSVVDVIVFT